jgi:hypothetical protein
VIRVSITAFIAVCEARQSQNFALVNIVNSAKHCRLRYREAAGGEYYFLFIEIFLILNG